MTSVSRFVAACEVSVNTALYWFGDLHCWSDDRQPAPDGSTLSITPRRRLKPRHIDYRNLCPPQVLISVFISLLFAPARPLRGDCQPRRPSIGRRHCGGADDCPKRRLRHTVDAAARLRPRQCRPRSTRRVVTYSIQTLHSAPVPGPTADAAPACATMLSGGTASTASAAMKGRVRIMRQSNTEALIFGAAVRGTPPRRYYLQARGVPQFHDRVVKGASNGLRTCRHTHGRTLRERHAGGWSSATETKGGRQPRTMRPA